MVDAPSLPDSWSAVDNVDGEDLVNKAELVDVPFMITALWFTENERGISFVYVEAERTDGTWFTFNDSSTGVREQLVNHLKNRQLDAAVDTGDVLNIEIVCPRGLRFSEFDVQVENPQTRRLETKKARTFYLTTAGRRRGERPTQAVTPAGKSSRSTRTRKAADQA